LATILFFIEIFVSVTPTIARLIRFIFVKLNIPILVNSAVDMWDNSAFAGG